MERNLNSYPVNSYNETIAEGIADLMSNFSDTDYFRFGSWMRREVILKMFCGTLNSQWNGPLPLDSKRVVGGSGGSILTDATL